MRTSIIAAAAGAAVMLACGVTLAAAPADWSKVEGEEIVLFYPGTSPMEWITGELRIDGERHGGARQFNQGESCVECHTDELVDMGEAIASGELLEPDPVPGKPGSIPVQVKAAHDGEKLYLRFSWTQPAAAGAPKMDATNPVKFAVMFDAGKVERADTSGCWASCHGDSRTMPDASNGKTKYVKGGSLADGVFYDLIQWRSGENKAYDGHVADTRVLEASTRLGASGTLEGDTWTVVFERRLAGGEGDISLESGKTYNFGVAIHNEHTAGRYHHVSLGYTLGIDAEADITAAKP
jgi:hypothetical protein